MEVIVVSHGDFAKGILSSVQMLLGSQEDLMAFGLYPEEDRDVLTEKVRGVLDSVKGGEEVIIASDLFHGTPFNVCVKLSEHYKFQHITGINLPLLIVIMMDRLAGNSAQEISNHVMQEAAGTVIYVNRILEMASGMDEEDDD